MRNGSYIHALGRMSFEPISTTQQPLQPQQQPLPSPLSPTLPSGEAERAEISSSAVDANAENSVVAAPQNPTPLDQSVNSRELQADLESAQNDVLATVGVCFRREMRPREETTDKLMKENEVGLIVGALDLTATYLSSWPLVGVRNHIQTFRAHERIRFIDIFRMVRYKRRFLEHFIGMPAHLTFQACGVLADNVNDRILRWLMGKKIFRDPVTGELRQSAMIALSMIDITLQLGTWCLAFPLYEHSTLQALHLAPPIPLLPPLSAFGLRRVFGAIMSTSAGILPDWIPAWIRVPLDSYVVLSFVESKLFHKIQSWCFNKLRRTLPRPNNPDQASILASIDGEENIEDLMDMNNRRMSIQVGPVVRRRSQQQQQPQQQTSPLEQRPEPDGSTAATAGATERQSDLSGTELEELWFTDSMQDVADAETEDDTAAARSAGEDEGGEEDAEQDEPGDNIPSQDVVEEFLLEHLQNLPIGTHLPDSDAALPIHPPRTSSLPQPQTGGATNQSEDNGSDDGEDRLTRPPIVNTDLSQHRLTTLSCHPCDAAASHVADAIAIGFTIGIENVLLRAIARHYILRRQSNGVLGTWYSPGGGVVLGPWDVYPPSNFRAGWKGVVKGMIVECVAAWGLWEVTYWASTWLGVGIFGYQTQL